ncbi:polyamine-transporting ATPase 13A3-like [Corticium candelabrum]|uniref:polyamine-transporting ATPase 13A3-like n=1 Tax=Corticium candelabrum TaxID=121492 RepID=UPI002E25CEBA|nr:polyamine-transporting ATPase 13A3-like [Corticium candelabrum]
MTGSSGDERLGDLGQSEVQACMGYRRHPVLIVLFVIMTLCTGGVLLLIAYWKPHWRLVLTSLKCRLVVADEVLIKSNDGESFVESVMTTGKEQEEEEIIELESSTQALLVNEDKTKSTCTVSLRYFIHRHQRFVFDWSKNVFELQTGLKNMTYSDLHNNSQGLSDQEVITRTALFGPNVIDVKVKPIWQLLYEEVLDPFYIFQWASVIFWCFNEYIYYAMAILFISFVSMGISLYQTWKQLTDLRNMVAMSSTVTTLRNNVPVEIGSHKLLPGDVIVIPPNGMLMPCDAVLISGTCIVNESMLTGESVPVTKTELPGKPTAACEKDGIVQASGTIYYPDRHKSHTLFCGTNVIQSRFYQGGKVVAIVIRTGFSTAKGSLVRAIMFPKNIGFQFFRDALRFVAVLCVLAAAGFTYSLVVSIQFHNGTKEIIFRALDLITTVVPPGLPAAMTVGIVYALQRLKKRNIYCISPPRVNVSGKIKLVCFDKTGTLTEDGLDLYGVIPCLYRQFQKMIPEGSDTPDGHLLFAMATCHTLTYIDGELAGDPIDLKMFQATGWVIEEHGEESTHYQRMIECEIKPRNAIPVTEEMLASNCGTFPSEALSLGVIKRFPFSSNLQRMSVIVSSLPTQKSAIYVKGAPEMIVSLSDKNTVPEMFHDELKSLTARGYRVLALAWKPLDVRPLRADRLTRKDVECDLRFLGLLVMQNKLKPETKPVIMELKSAAIRCVMATGDNIDTAISVARECNLISPGQDVVLVSASMNESDDNRMMVTYRSVINDTNALSSSLASGASNTDLAWYQKTSFRLSPRHDAVSDFVFAMTGSSFSLIRCEDLKLLNKVVVRGIIFARMSPEQKRDLVESLQDLGFCVCMCGDGANDCGALRAANAGISLSEAEASVASPFTSKTPNITCVPSLIKEGRAALDTSFSVFKYMALYSMIEFVTVLMLYSINSNLGDFQYLYVDLVVVLVIALVMERTEAYPHLAKRRPFGRLASFYVLFSIFSQIIVQVTTLVIAYQYLKGETWFSPLLEKEDEDNIVCYESTVLFCMCSFLMINVAVAFATGAPYRQPMYTNQLFLWSVVILMCLTTYITVWPPGFLISVLQLRVPPPYLFRVALVEMVGVSFMISIIIDHFMVRSEWLKRMWTKVRRKKEPKNLYKHVEREISEDPDWPPLS